MLRALIPLSLLFAGSAALSADRADSALADQAKLERKLAGLTPGKPQACIRQTRVRSSDRVGDTLLYSYSNREIYRADTDGGCFGLRRGDAVISRTPSEDLCTGDILRTRDLLAGIDSGACTIRAFVPYRR